MSSKEEYDKKELSKLQKAEVKELRTEKRNNEVSYQLFSDADVSMPLFPFRFSWTLVDSCLFLLILVHTLQY